MIYKHIKFISSNLNVINSTWLVKDTREPVTFKF